MPAVTNEASPSGGFGQRRISYVSPKAAAPIPDVMFLFLACSCVTVTLKIPGERHRRRMNEGAHLETLSTLHSFTSRALVSSFFILGELFYPVLSTYGGTPSISSFPNPSQLSSKTRTYTSTLSWGWQSGCRQVAATIPRELRMGVCMGWGSWILPWGHMG